MTKALALSAAALLSFGAIPAFAEGDAAAGEQLWRNCRSCHSIVADDDTVIQRGGRTGPNLYGLPGRAVASVEGFRYGPALLEFAAMDGGQVWTEELFLEYAADPTGFLRAHRGNPTARSAMTYRLNSGADDMWAYLASVSPAVDSDDQDDDDEDEGAASE